MRRAILLIALVCAWPSSARAACSPVQTATGVITASGTSHQISLTGVSAGNSLVVSASYLNEAITATVADSQTNTYAAGVPVTSADATFTWRGYQWYVKTAAAGNTTVTVTTSLAVVVDLHLIELSGCHQTTILDDTASAQFNNNTTALTTTIDPTASGLVVSMIRSTSALTINTPATGNTQRATTTNSSLLTMPVSAGANTIGGTSSANEFAMIIGAVYLDAAGGAATQGCVVGGGILAPGCVGRLREPIATLARLVTPRAWLLPVRQGARLRDWRTR